MQGAQDRDMQGLQEDSSGKKQYTPERNGGQVGTVDRSHCSLEWYEPYSGHSLNAARRKQNQLCDHLGHLQHNRHGHLC